MELFNLHGFSLPLLLMPSPYYKDVILKFVSMINFICFSACYILEEDLGLVLLLPGGFRQGAFGGVLVVIG